MISYNLYSTSFHNCNIISIKDKKTIWMNNIMKQNPSEFLCLAECKSMNNLQPYFSFYACCSHYSQPFVSWLRRAEMHGILLNQHLRQEKNTKETSELEQNVISWRTELHWPFTFLGPPSSHEAITDRAGIGAGLIRCLISARQLEASLSNPSSSV